MNQITANGISPDVAQYVPKKHRIIVLDSNILIQNYAFNSHSMKNLLDFAQKTDSYIYIHKIVIDEVSMKIKLKCNDAIKEITKNLDELKKWGAEIPELNKEKIIINLLEKFLNNVSIPNGVSIGASETGNFESTIIVNRKILAPLDASDLDETITRLIKRVPPSKDNGEGFRDTMIWLNMLKYCKKHFNKCPVAFISANTKEFADGDRTLKEKLLEDVKLSGLDLEYFTSVPDFLKKYAEPIYGIDLNWIDSRLDMKEVKKLIQDGGLLQNFVYYDRLGQQIHLQNSDWNINLQDFYLFNKNETSLEVDLIFGINIENDIIIKKELKKLINNIRIELYGNIVEDNLIINPYSQGIRWEEI